MLLNCGVGKDSWESLGLQGNSTSPSKRKSVLNIHWKDLYWMWNSNTLATWCEELTHWKRPWCWERLKVEGDDRKWDGWMASRTQMTWVWVGSGSWWWTGKPGVLQSMGSQSWTQLSDWTELIHFFHILFHYGLSQDFEYSSLFYAVEPYCLSILYIPVCICEPQIPLGASLVAQLVKNLPTMQETLVQFLGQEDPLEKG